jgi:serine/threonine protein kinase
MMNPHNLVGAVLKDKYRVVETVGTGAMSSIFRATRTDGSGDVAVKVLHAHVLVREGQRERFDREVRALEALKHPRILEIVDHGIADNAPFLVTELLDGTTLDALVKSALPSPDDALDVACQILDGLGFAHKAGMIHRDLKTENIYVTRDADGKLSAKLLDFGLVKFLDDAKWGFAHQLTATGDVFGSPAYMSPEQALGLELDPRSDLYSMGVVLFEVITGRLPFEEPSTARMMNAHVSLRPPKVAEARPDVKLPAGLQSVFTKALAKQREHRFPSAEAMKQALERVRAGTASEFDVPISTHGGTFATTERLDRRPVPRWPRFAVAALGGSAAGVVLALLVRWTFG